MCFPWDPSSGRHGALVIATCHARRLKPQSRLEVFGGRWALRSGPIPKTNHETEMGGLGWAAFPRTWSKKKAWEGSAKVIFKGFLEAVAQTQQVPKRLRRTVSRSSESVPDMQFLPNFHKTWSKFPGAGNPRAPCRNLLKQGDDRARVLGMNQKGIPT